MSFRIAALLFAMLAAHNIQAADWRIDPAHSRLGFAYQAMGAEMQGEFNRFSADVRFDPAQPQSASVRLTVDTGSIDAGLPEATAEARSANFLDAARYPQAQFVSTSVKPLGQQRYQVNGELTLRNQRRPLSVVILLKPEGKQQRLNGTLLLKRLDYGIGTGMWGDTGTLANEVRAAFSLLLIPHTNKSATGAPRK